MSVQQSGNDENSNANTVQEIEELHQTALLKGSTTYIDPETGFTVFTELFHLKRGTCCGNQCRHCPYGWSNVPHANTRRQSKLQSGDKETAQRLMQQIMTSSFVSTGVAHSRLNEEYPEQGATNIESLTISRTSNAEEEKQYGKGGRKGGRLTNKNVPYTRSGDKGTSQLLTGERRSKADDVFEAMGTVDELCSVVGVVHAILVHDDSNSSHDYGELPEWILEVMSRLFDIGSHVAKPRRVSSHDNEDDATKPFDADGVGGGFHAAYVDLLEDWIDIMTEQLPELTSFILPTGSKAAAQLHVARTVCRRAERRVVVLGDDVCDPNAVRYLNRLSDFFFSAARWVNYRQQREELQYKREYRGAKQRNRVAVSLEQRTEANDKN